MGSKLKECMSKHRKYEEMLKAQVPAMTWPMCMPAYAYTELCGAEGGQIEEFMNKRQIKKRFKRRYGFNPPKGLSVRTARNLVEYRERIFAALQRIIQALLDSLGRLKECVSVLIDRD